MARLTSGAVREGHLRELAKRENRNTFIRSGRVRPITPTSYSEYYLP